MKPTGEQIARFMDEIEMLDGARDIEDRVHEMVPTILVGLLSGTFAPPEGSDIPEAFVSSARAVAAEAVRQNCAALDAIDAAEDAVKEAFKAIGGNPYQPQPQAE